MDIEKKREIILHNFENPKNRGLVVDDNYETVNTRNDSCIDKIDMMINVENEIIKDIKFDGEACAITISSTSIMIQRLVGLSIKEAILVVDNFESMIEGKSYDKELLKEALCYDDISKQPSRKTCALLPWKGIRDLLINKL